MPNQEKPTKTLASEVLVLRERVADLENQIREYQQTTREYYTGQDETGQALKKSENLFRELFNNMSSSVAIYKSVDDGMDFEFLDFNRAGEETERLDRNEIIGKRVTTVFPTIDDFGLLEVFQRVWKTGISESYPISQYQDGRISGWRENFVYKLPTGEIVALYDDVTERKQAEEELMKLKDALKYQVTEKTKELQTRINELERFYNTTIEREFRMKELRDEIERLKKSKR